MKDCFLYVFVLSSVNKCNNNQFGSGFTKKYCPWSATTFQACRYSDPWQYFLVKLLSTGYYCIILGSWLKILKWFLPHSILACFMCLHNICVWWDKLFLNPTLEFVLYSSWNLRHPVQYQWRVCYRKRPRACNGHSVFYCCTGSIWYLQIKLLPFCYSWTSQTIRDV